MTSIRIATVVVHVMGRGAMACQYQGVCDWSLKE